MSKKNSKEGKPAPVDGITRERKWPFFIPVTIWVGFSYIAASLIVVFGLNLLKLFNISYGNMNQDVFTAVLSGVIYLLFLALVLGLPRLAKLWSSRISYRRLLGFTRLMQWRDILFAVLGFAVYLAFAVGLVLVITSLVPGFNTDQAQELGFSKTLTPTNAILVFLTLVVVAPVAEEVIFRGYLFGTLRRAVPVWVAALITSLVFGLIHGQWNVGVDVFAMSLVSCFLRYKTGSLWASILLHMAKNGLAFYALYIATSSIL